MVKGFVNEYTIDYNGLMLFESLDHIMPLIEPPIIIGISGGVDSMVLLHAMTMKNYPVIAAHFNHNLREGSDKEAEFLKDYCLQESLPFREGSGDVSQYSEENNLSIEEAGRILRYQFLFEVARTEKAGAVAVAHHADDQIETILMNLLRGAGAKGLAGMKPISVPNPWSSTIPVVRPLLDFDKQELIRYQEEHQLPVLEDPTNTDESYFRNRIRHTLIPQLEELKPGVRSRLLQTSQILGAEDQALEFFTILAWKTCLNSKGASYIQLNRDELLEFPVAIQRRLIRNALNTLRPDFRELSFLHVEAALEFIRDPSRKSSNWVAKVNLSQSPKRVVLSTWETDLVKDQFPQLLDRKEIPLAVDEEIALGNGWYLEIHPAAYSAGQFEEVEIPGEDFMVWVDRDKLLPGGVIRGREEGDAIKPLGMGGRSIKLSDLMINEKIPAPYRESWPIVVREEEILWVPGGRLSREAKITEKTGAVVELRFIRRTP